jgi:hypothetical protein
VKAFWTLGKVGVSNGSVWAAASAICRDKEGVSSAVVGTLDNGGVVPISNVVSGSVSKVRTGSDWGVGGKSSGDRCLLRV